VACHEGYVGSDKNSEPLLPLINLENNACFAKPEMAENVAAKKRNTDIIEQALSKSGAHTPIDVAYYYPTLSAGILQHLPDTKMVGIIRACEAFVRSSAYISGEDPLPVGWPDPS